MAVAAFSLDEHDRLGALADMHIMDSAPDVRFDNLARLAADIYKVPIALITLLDEKRQWFKSAIGLPLTQTPREHAFCHHTIQQPNQVMVVEDARTDPRFANNPLVQSSPNIRFYAGASVRSPSGHPLGTLCVIDSVPRQMSEAACKQLQLLADGVSAMLDMHRTTIELQRLATQDPLTGLANRALFDQRLDMAVNDSLAGRPSALVLLDIDRFQNINRRFGTTGGNQLLRVVGQRLQNLVRPGDVVARLGGDEFAILQTDVRDSEMLHHLAGRIEAALSVPVMLENEQVFPRASIGMALCPSDAIEAGALLRAADHALYQAKRSGGGRSILASGGTRASLLSTPGQDLETDLRIALAAEELQVHWQPYVNASTGVVRGFEALARWHRPGHGQVAPNVFVPFAEATGLIARLDTWMLEAACRQAASWPSPVQISVNLSAHWFGGPDLIPLIERTAGKTGMPLSRLCIEVTERTLIAAKHIAREQIDALAALGVRVGLDDFGVGFSSLGYLRELPFDTLKLDRSFITSLGRDVRSEQVAGAIIKLGHLLGMTVCAEGVETTTQLQCLKRQGCDLVQGFLFGSPSSTPDFTPRDVVRAVVGRKRFPPQDRPKTITSEKAAEFADD